MVSVAIHKAVSAMGCDGLFRANILVLSFFFYMSLLADSPGETSRAVYLVLSITGVVFKPVSRVTTR